MRKSKHFRKDVIIARVIVLALFLLLLVLGRVLVSAFLKPSADKEKTSQYEQQENRVDTSYNYNSGYVKPEVSETEEVSEEVSETEPEEVFVKTTAQIRFRVGPGTDYEAIGYLEKNTKVLLIEEVKGWYKVLYNGKEGYISADYAVKIQE